MAPNLDLFRMHLYRQPDANTKLDLRSPIVDRDYHDKGLYYLGAFVFFLYDGASTLDQPRQRDSQEVRFGMPATRGKGYDKMAGWAGLWLIESATE